MKAIISLSVIVVIAGQSAWGPPAGSRERTTGPKSGTVKKREEQNMGLFVIVCYRPKPGKEAALLELVRNHVPDLRKQGLVTDRPGYAMRAKDGTVVEVFEWKSAKATEEAHTNPAVQAMWQQFGEACDYEMIGNLPEAKQLFSSFAPIDMGK